MRRVIGTDELKNFHDDPFQLIPQEGAGLMLFVLVVIFIILEPCFR